MLKKIRAFKIPMSSNGATWQYQNPPFFITKNIGGKLFYYSDIDFDHPL
jgi:hypothetical protein